MKSENLDKYYLVIGAGPVGLAVAKSFKEAGIKWYMLIL